MSLLSVKMDHSNNIFKAARAGDLKQLNHFLAIGASVNDINDYNHTALQCAVMSSNSVDEDKILPVIRKLIEAGSPLEYAAEDGRTALYLAAEFSPSLTIIKTIIEAGAKADIYAYGDVHIVVNAMSKEVQRYLSNLTGHPIPEPEPEIPTQKLTSSQWKAAYRQINNVFISLNKLGILTLHDAGITQEDGFDDCTELYYQQKETSIIQGFCFYSRQDQNRAKRTGQLSLSFWAAPKGENEAMKKSRAIDCKYFQRNQIHCLLEWATVCSTYNLSKYSQPRMNAHYL